MKKSNWLTDIMIEKLQTISRDVSLRFGDNLKGRGHWEEIEFMRRSFPYGGWWSLIHHGYFCFNCAAIVLTMQQLF